MIANPYPGLASGWQAQLRAEREAMQSAHAARRAHDQVERMYEAERQLTQRLQTIGFHPDLFRGAITVTAAADAWSTPQAHAVIDGVPFVYHSVDDSGERLSLARYCDTCQLEATSPDIRTREELAEQLVDWYDRPLPDVHICRLTRIDAGDTPAEPPLTATDQLTLAIRNCVDEILGGHGLI